MSEGGFKPRPPDEQPENGRHSARILLNQITASQGPEIPSVWSQIQAERRKITAAPAIRAKEQQKADIAVRVKTAIAPTSKNEEEKPYPLSSEPKRKEDDGSQD